MAATSGDPQHPAQELRLRTGRPDDVGAVVGLWLLADAEPTVTDDPASLLQLIAREPEALIVAEVDGEIVGSLIAGFDGWRGHLYRLAVDPQRRRGGLGLAMVAEAERRLIERGAKRVNALVVSGHAQAVAFWEAAGYGLDTRIGRHVKNLT